MIPGPPVPIHEGAFDSDFTLKNYGKMLCIAKQNYEFSTYSSIPWGKRFILWRHDCDFSLNRARELASIEAAEGVKTTYFLNLHSEFYNLFEKSQHSLVTDIISMGHDVGLHFQTNFYKSFVNEAELENSLSSEITTLQQLFGVKPSAFSFHNPTQKDLKFNREVYGGLINCYSKRFTNEVGYYSDSNGYWRFKKLADVLSDAEDHCLQVLTHPGWWQKQVMPPRQRIFRCIYGRAAATLKDYDKALNKNGRKNITGQSSILKTLKIDNVETFELYDFLWNSGHFQTLFNELVKLHQKQIKVICQVKLYRDWGVPEVDINAFFEESERFTKTQAIFEFIFEIQTFEAIQFKEIEYISLIRNVNNFSKEKLESRCVFLCEAINCFETWANKHFALSNQENFLHLNSNFSEHLSHESPDEAIENSQKKNRKFKKESWKALKNCFPAGH